MQYKKDNKLAIKNFNWRQNIVYIAFVIVFLFFSITLFDAGFLSKVNILNIFRQTAIIAVMGVGMTFVISTGEIDLSVGSITALSSLTTALSLEAGYGIILSSIIGLGTGLLIGLANGFLTSSVGIPSFIVTLGMMEAVRGAAMWITNTAPVPIMNERYNFWFGSGNILSIPVLLFWMLLIAIAGDLVYRKTVFGRYTLATGGNEEAARYTGINTNRIKLLTFVLSGTLAGLAGMLYAGRMQSGRFSFGDGDELNVIAAVILGGTSLFGGKGTIVGTIFGALIMGVINNGLILAGLEVSQQMMVSGFIIILAVAFGSKKEKE
ncbi:ABC transporter permease [Petrotoga halophila]|jgi:ribose transport system permease protein|uniref:ABC transporter permease n=1 Tax=Petrotoga halophila DSM 16923 TaxID=1122953 RepID=A0A2S5EJT2_9BACT|nr:ABC transporter permease [Petrotoga halophila]POZ93380.1 ABC transporter permease [Petrotoga halophila DSM 16923]